MDPQASRFVDSVPVHYDRGLGPHIFVDYAADLARRAAELEPTEVLELAAGTGIATRALRDALGNDCSLVASDLNSPMLDVAREKFGPDEKVRFEQADATQLHFEDADFDLVTCQFGVMFFPDRERSFREVCRVLRPAGTYVFSTWHSWAENHFARLAHDNIVAFFPHDPPGFYAVPFGYHDTACIRAELLAAGFDDVRIEDVRVSTTISDARLFAEGLVRGNPCHEEVLSRGGDPEAVIASLTGAIDQQLGGELEMNAMLITATR